MRGSSSNRATASGPNRRAGQRSWLIENRTAFVSSKASAMPGFRSPGKLGRIVVSWPARRDRPDGLRTRRAPVARRKIGKDGAAGGWRGEAAGLGARVRVAGGTSAVVPTGTEDQSKPGTRGTQGSRAAAAVPPGPGRATDGPLLPACATAGGRRRPAVRRGPSRPPAPLTAAATSPSLVSWSWAPDGSGARQGGPVILPPRTEPAGTGRHRLNAR
jgi:hypothetical protein